MAPILSRPVGTSNHLRKLFNIQMTSLAPPNPAKESMLQTARSTALAQTSASSRRAGQLPNAVPRTPKLSPPFMLLTSGIGPAPHTATVRSPGIARPPVCSISKDRGLYLGFSLPSPSPGSGITAPSLISQTPVTSHTIHPAPQEYNGRCFSLPVTPEQFSTPHGVTAGLQSTACESL